VKGKCCEQSCLDIATMAADENCITTYLASNWARATALALHTREKTRSHHERYEVKTSGESEERSAITTLTRFRSGLGSRHGRGRWFWS
jgi:hypothetical protein